MAYETNIAKGATLDNRDEVGQCPLCGLMAMQAHINTTCSRPALADLRMTHRLEIDLHFLSLRRYTVLPPAQRWIELPLHHADTYLWENSEVAGDIWNCRWSHHTIADVLQKQADTQIPPTEYAQAIRWLAQLTLLLQKTQAALTRSQLLRQVSRLATTVVTPWKSRLKSLGPRFQTLFLA